MEELNHFYNKIENKDALSAGQLIPYFVYFLCQNSEWTTPTAVSECFKQLDLHAYSNISSYLSKNSGNSNSLFLKSKNGYKLSRKAKEELKTQIGEQITVPVTNNLLNLVIFKNAPYYILHLSEDMNKCYDICLYNASLVLMRKLLETLIIETFERFGCQEQIKDTNGYYLFLSDLIPLYCKCNKLSPSRNINESMKAIKKYGDLSAHNRAFIAKKHHLDDLKNDLDQATQELVNRIDYPNWSRDKNEK